MRLGLTGSIGTGKTLVLEEFRSRGFPVLQTDRLGHELLETDDTCRQEVMRAFGEEVWGVNRTVDRKKLAELVFRQPEKRQVLNGILHPRIRKMWVTWQQDVAKEGCGASVVEIPLLFEAGARSHFDAVVTVSCGASTQIRRVMERSGLDEDQARKRMGAQWPSERKMEAADYVVWNEFSPALIPPQVDRLLAKLGLSA